MKKALSIFLICTLMLQCFSRLGIFVCYQLNKDYIAKVLCINRDKPQMHCNGRCHLKKQLQKADEQDKKTATDSVSKTEIVWACQEYVTYRFNFVSITEQPHFLYQSHYCFSLPVSLFHPPQRA